MIPRKKVVVTYRCNACYKKELAEEGYACTYISDTQTDAQGWCVSRCPIFDYKPKWEFVSREVIE